MDNLLNEEEIYNDCKNVFEEMFEGETISDLCYFKVGWVMKACKAVLQTQLSKLLSTVPDVREKVRKYLCPDSNTEGCGVKCPGYKNCSDEANHIHALYAPAILAAADEANAKWVTALKPFGITVDSPESLVGAVQVLLDEAVQQERERIIQVILDTEPDPHT